jgi:AcrR family transcriptional regulator
MATAARRKRLDAPARRESILAAAVPAFATAGYERTRVADVAARVGVTEPVVFQNFGSKPGLFAAVLERAADEVVRYITELAGHSTGVAETLAVVLAPDHQERLHASGGLGRLFDEAAGSTDAAIREAGHRAHRRTVKAVAELLRRGQREGSVRDDVEAESIAWLLLSQLHAAQFRRAHSEASPILERAMLEALLAALRP